MRVPSRNSWNLVFMGPCCCPCRAKRVNIFLDPWFPLGSTHSMGMRVTDTFWQSQTCIRVWLLLLGEFSPVRPCVEGLSFATRLVPFDRALIVAIHDEGVFHSEPLSWAMVDPVVGLAVLESLILDSAGSILTSNLFPTSLFPSVDYFGWRSRFAPCNRLIARTPK